MEPWKAYIGNGSGCFFSFNQYFIDEGLFNENHASTLEAIVNLPNVTKAQMAIRYGIEENSPENKKKIYSLLKSEIFRIDSVEYFFDKRFFYNPNLTQSEAFDFVLNNNISGLVNNNDTIELNKDTGSAFLDYLL